MVWRWFGANMAGQRNKNAFKFLLQLLILSQKHILCVKKVVWDGLDVDWGGLEVVWGGLWCFGGGLGCFHGPEIFSINLDDFLSIKQVFIKLSAIFMDSLLIKNLRF